MLNFKAAIALLIVTPATWAMSPNIPYRQIEAARLRCDRLLLGRYAKTTEAPQAKTPAPAPNGPSAEWKKSAEIADVSKNIPVNLEPAETVAEAIVRKGLKNLDFVISEDQMGPLTYGEEFERALGLARVLEDRFSGQNRLAILFPSTAANTTIYLASHLAGKVPVYVNFTSPTEAVEKGLQSIGVTGILTSRKVIENLPKKYSVEAYKHRFVFIEDLLSAAKLQVLRIRAHRLLSPKFFSDELLKRSRRTDLAVILFTSGSSGVPKAVPLSHKNLLANNRDVVEVLNLKENDRSLMFLPPFHSFGHLLISQSQALSMAAAYWPNPGDYAGLAALIRSYRPTLLAATGSILESVALLMEKPNTSVRYIFLGSEGVKPHQFELFKKMFPNAEALEGYGMTELSPAFSLNRVGQAKPGTIGQPLPSFIRGGNYRLVNPDTFEPVPLGKIGVLICKGESVFSGYLNTDTNPFVTVDGEKWFNTGDLFIQREKDGPLTFKGRTTRSFRKKGEWIDVDGIEAVLAQFLEAKRPVNSDGAKTLGPLAVVEMAGDNQPLVLFTTIDLGDGAIHTVNAELRRRGFPPLYMISKVEQVPEIPLLGSGKVDYKPFRQILLKAAQTR
jgi:acyl-CoA synthetase (AMP-forming)/AMP-acid ligase II